MAAAERAAIGYLGSVPAETQVGLVAVGHRGTNRPSGRAESCRGAEMIYRLAANLAEV